MFTALKFRLDFHTGYEVSIEIMTQCINDLIDSEYPCIFSQYKKSEMAVFMNQMTRMQMMQYTEFIN